MINTNLNNLRSQLLVVMLLMCATTWGMIKVSGQVDASLLPDNAELMLTGNTNLYMDVNKTIKAILADYELTVSGGNILTVSNSDGDAIVSGGDISISGGTIKVMSPSGIGINALSGNVSLSGNITIESDQEGILAKKDITINGSVKITNNNRRSIYSKGGSLTVIGNLNCDGDGIVAYNDVSISGSTIDVNSQSIGVYAERNIVINCGKINVKGRPDGIKSNNGHVSLSGDITIESEERGVSGARYVKINGNSKIYCQDNGYSIYSGLGGVNVQGNLYAEGSVAGNQDVIISGETIVVKFKGKGNNSKSSAIHAHNGHVTLYGDITVESDINGVFGGRGVGIEGSTKINCKNDGKSIVSSFGGVNVKGDLSAEGVINGNINVTIAGGTINIKDKRKGARGKTSAIHAHNGHTTLSGDITIETEESGVFGARGVGIKGNSKIYCKNDGYSIFSSFGGVNVKGDLETEGSVYGFTDVTITGNTIKVKDMTDSKSAAIRAHNGTAKVVGDIDIESINNGIECMKEAYINGSAKIVSKKGYCVKSWGTRVEGELLMASFNTSAVTYVNNISFENSVILYPDGASVIKGNGSNSIETVVYGTIVDGSGNPATQVLIGKYPISGTINYTGLAVPGEQLGFTLSGTVIDAEYTCQWQISEDGIDWADIRGMKDVYYTPTRDDLGKMIRVKLSAKTLKGCLYGDSRKVGKYINNEIVVPLKLGVENGQIFVDYAVPSQEYMILSYNKAISNLTESDWANAVSPKSSGKLVMDGTKGFVNYVYTRKKETNSTCAGSNVASEQIYLGDESLLIQGIKMNVSLMEMDGKSPCFTPLDKEDNGAYYVKYGDVIRIKASQLPETATFYGIHSSRWINNEKGGKFYANYQCTMELDANTSYKEVYYKAEKQMNNNEIIAEYVSGGQNNVYYDRFYLNVASEDGYVLMDRFNQSSVTLTEGEKLTDIAIRTYPLKATLTSTYALIIDKDGLPGTPPTVTFDDETHSISVDATNATAGKYSYEVYQKGMKMPNVLEVEVTSHLYPVEGIALLTKALSLNPGESAHLVLELTPTNSKTKSVTWSITDPGLATISDDGVITAKADAQRGKSCIIRVSVDAKYLAECTLTIPKLIPNLSFCETSFEIFDYETFTAPPLSNPNGLGIKYSSSNDAVATVDETTGVVTVKGIGATYITAYYEGDDVYDYDSASYQLSVNVKGDANGDWMVDEDDVTAISDYILTGGTAYIVFDNADLNGDKKVDAADLVLLINKVNNL